MQAQEKEELLYKLLNLRNVGGLHILGPDAPSSMHFIARLEAAASAEYAIGAPRTDLILGLNQLNILRALTTNIEVLGFTASEMHDDASSPFFSPNAWLTSRRIEWSNLPATLTPTAIQCTIEHHPWLDLIPLPQLRDNLILADAAGQLDEYQLCHDLCGHQSAPDGFSGVLVWRDPWDASGWEITGKFLERWGWVLQDCWELWVSTNYWRTKRGVGKIGRGVWAEACEQRRT
ncbi:hypothetical protein CC86DRAFT_359537 [Ophiobolus disseminans]|uniref:Uncharacterized protein n=1 Tax=Ophiobolus disseminans TaxID=1469910 RepID=A0A6A6ZJ88_9PLEO|nr:hypothetical protein CC86DRAFT_359537 [Ophiobolus disseminans]